MSLCLRERLPALLIPYEKTVYSLQQVDNHGPDPALQRSLIREYLQARLLLALQDCGAFADWAFLGGTALRFLYQRPRYSEDLDFSLAELGRNPRFRERLKSVKGDLERETYQVDIRVRDKQTVLMAMVKFRGILHEMGASPHPDETLQIKLEVDSRPPAGAVLTTTLIRRNFVLHLMHYDRASLLAGKLHAILARAYTKGRDLYDLMWYLSAPDWPDPNMTLLNNALAQTGWDKGSVTPRNWRHIVGAGLARMNWPRALADVRPFLERPRDEALLTRENLLNLLAKTGA